MRWTEGDEMAQTEAQRRAALKYTKKSVKQLNISLFPSDQDIIDHLETIPKKAEYIRRLIREDIGRSK